MKLINLYEEMMDGLFFNYEASEDGVDIIALRNRKVVGKLSLVFIIDAWSEFEDAIESGELPEEDYIKIFSNDRFAKIEHLNVIDGEKGKGIAKELVSKAIIYAKKDGEKVMYLNASPMGFTGLNINALVGFYKSFGFQPLIDSGHNVEMFANI